MTLLTGKRALITGVASERSIAWGIAQALNREGAELAFTYPNIRLKERVEKFAQKCSSDIVLPCDVANDTEIESMFTQLKDRWTNLDILIHAIAYAPKEQLEGDYLQNVTREGFRIAHDISSYSLAAMAKYSREMMQGRQASIVTLSYLGAERAMPNYNVMGLAKASLEANVRYLAYTLGPEGIRVNAISAGPIRTLAASGISDFRRMLEQVEQTAPLRKNVTIDEVGNTALFLSSDLASGITGETIYVDAGYNIVGLG
ncbi:enoyl-[acyl-carrier-protein] reductase [Acidihalobacter aeolianus]|uniref:Enoyl-[acyl-carrier-protein] reductase [NADH] n=1 Tax=Acidihalobacter aeolianus TaxID=2792603 RepID=A0A1D8K8U0_9GAMM|nr:enoyl-ACP reductase [Acidihalobacter aeolianus]AOV17345.1 enoyl-[acyl-carrier-protein] reductase [Acidihalobacter aeolianus]